MNLWISKTHLQLPDYGLAFFFFFYIFIDLPNEHKYKIVIPSAKRKAGCNVTFTNIFRHELCHFYITVEQSFWLYFTHYVDITQHLPEWLVGEWAIAVPCCIPCELLRRRSIPSPQPGGFQCTPGAGKGISHPGGSQVMLMLPALLGVLQRRAGMCPKSKELLPPSLSILPKANHIGASHLRCSRAPWQPGHDEIKHLQKGWEERLGHAKHIFLVQILQKEEHMGPCLAAFCLEDVHPRCPQALL